MLTKLLGISPDDTDSEVRGKLADALGAEGFKRERLTRILRAKQSQMYVDLKNGFRLTDRRAREANGSFGSPLTAAG